MNTSTLKKFLPTVAMLKVIGCALGFAALLSLFYLFVIRTQAASLVRAQGDVESMRKKSQQYRYFDEFTHRLEQQKDKVIGIINDYDGAIDDVDKKKESGMAEDVAKECDRLGIELEKKEFGNKELHVTFYASYQQISSFVSRVEKIYRINALKVQSGQKAPRHKVEATIVLLRSAGPKVVPVAGDFMDVFDKATTIMQDIEKKNVSARDNTPRRDPFVLPVALIPAVRVATPKEEVLPPPPPLNIDGIYWDPQTPVIVIDGRAVREGDTIQGVKIKKIEEKDVVIIWRGHNYTIKPAKKD